MKTYANINGNSGVTAYKPGRQSIIVQFSNNTVYKYTYKSAGKAVVEKMKVLAEDGRGLSTYISLEVKDNYETKIK